MLNFNFPVFRRAFKNTIPVLTGYLMLGFGFGVLLVSHQFPLWLAPFMSLTIYAGALQYLSVEMLANHTDYFTIAVTTFLVNARHLFYGISLIEKYKRIYLPKIYLAFGLTDETYSLIACSPTENESKEYYIYVTFLDHLYWISGGFLGAVFGKIIPFNSDGIDFVLTALFIAIFTEQWLNTDKHFSAVIGILATLICLIAFDKNYFLIPSMVLITLAIIWARRFEIRRTKS